MKLDKIMKLAAETQELEPDDKLTQLIAENSEDELSDEEMDLVTAAASVPDIGKLKEFIKKAGK